MQDDSAGIIPSKPDTSTSEKRIQPKMLYHIRCNKGKPDQQTFEVLALNLFDALTFFYRDTEQQFSQHPKFETLDISVRPEITSL